ncbi:hypothetical protein DFA_03575 [Cavenderia fasciculata]|uniref:mRNA (guanine-N(7))-methyltransferase n=1 Tax=Cavenderia fasciculata TaxID=261658 RepID=F4PI43_CACFS|nr:uncharacterized protein DFA_03575 [Cavenderia fasciculata]EGG25326.1 hypothetical protein DFA_03575 [Cavenderia fasciculata]|eukprot:XP_004363177.1 hypothetical protein DFA_03575 [Cavenderia fasciculata]
MYLQRFYFAFIALLLLSGGAYARTVKLDKCSSTCRLDSMLALVGGALTRADDVVIQGTQSAIYNIAQPITCRALSIATGTVNLNSNVNILGDLRVDAGAKLVINGALSATGLIKVDGELIVLGGISSIGNMACAGKVLVQGGTLNINGLLFADTSALTVAGGIVKHSGNCAYNTLPIVKGTGQIFVNTGANIDLNKGIKCLDQSILNLAANAKVNLNADSQFLTPIIVNAGANVLVNKGKCDFTGGIKGTAGSILTILNGAANVAGDLNTCHKIDLTGAGSLNVNAGALTCADLKAIATSKINLSGNGALLLDANANVVGKINLSDLSNIVVKADCDAKILGGMTCSGNSVVQVLDNAKLDLAKDCHFVNPLTIGSQSTVTLTNGITNCAKGINSKPDSTFIIDDKATCNIAHNSNVGDIKVNANGALNVNGGITNVNGIFHTADKSTAAITNAILNLKSDAEINSKLLALANSKISLEGLTNLNAGIQADTTAKIDIAKTCNINAASTLNCHTNLNANAILNMNGNKVTHSCGKITTAPTSTLNLNKGCNLNIVGAADINGATKLCDGSNIKIHGVANINSGIQTVGNIQSIVNVAKAGTCKLASDTSINGKILIDAGGNLIVNGKCAVNDLQNAGKVIVTKPITITGDKFIHANADASIDLNGDGMISCKEINFAKGALNGVGKMACTKCTFGNNIDANLNVQGDVVIQPTANLIARVHADATGAIQAVPVIIASGAANIAGNVNIICDAATKIAAGHVIKLVSAANVSGNLNVVANASAAANANIAANAWNMVYPKCACECYLQKNSIDKTRQDMSDTNNDIYHEDHYQYQYNNNSNSLNTDSNNNNSYNPSDQQQQQQQSYNNHNQQPQQQQYQPQQYNNNNNNSYNVEQPYNNNNNYRGRGGGGGYNNYNNNNRRDYNNNDNNRRDYNNDHNNRGGGGYRGGGRGGGRGRGGGGGNNRYNPYGNNQQQNHHQHQYQQNNNNEPYGTINKSISEHYGQRTNIPLHIRDQSRILNMKNTNNWVKSVMIQKYVNRDDSVFDICGGKLGDLQKWIKASISTLYIADVALDSLKDGVERHNERIKNIQFNTTFICCDCFSPKLLQAIPPTVKFDLVSCQFAIHYSFRSEESVRNFLQNVSSVLKDGGYFIGNFPDSQYIVEKCKENNSNKFGNSVFNIKFKEDEPKFEEFGCAYQFFLEDAIDGLDEYLVDPTVLSRVAKEYDLEMVQDEDFHTFIERERDASDGNKSLYHKMHCLNDQGTISKEEWEALRIYRVFAFKKLKKEQQQDDQTSTSTNNDNNNNNNDNGDGDDKKDNQNNNNNYQNRRNRNRIPFININDIIIIN